MNKKAYWKIRKIVLSLVFKIKVCLYSLLESVYENGAYGPLRKIIIQSALLGVLKSVLCITIVTLVSDVFFNTVIVTPINSGIFVAIATGGIGVAGVILGLYCTNVATIYSSRYVNAPRIIVEAFQNDSLSNKCVSGIVEYIVFGFVAIFATIVRNQASWAIFTIFILWSVVTIVAYGIAGKRSHQLSDEYGVAVDAHRLLYRVVTKRLTDKKFSNDISFQDVLLKTAEKQIQLLKAIQIYKSGANSINKGDNSSIGEFMGNNLALIKSYWGIKKGIVESSLWFKSNQKYPRWHLAGETEISLALKTGIPLSPKGEHNYWWFEEELLAINKNCLRRLFEQHDFGTIYSYMLQYRGLSACAISCREANFYVMHVDWISHLIEKEMTSRAFEGEEKSGFVAVLDAISLLYLDLILEISKVYQCHDFDKLSKQIIKSIDLGRDVETNRFICGSADIEFYRRISTEIKVEGKRVTPNWVVNQHIAKEEYTYLNSLLDIVREGLKQAFNLGEKLLESKLYFESCIVLTRFYEYESKLTRFISIVKQRQEELTRFYIDKTAKWDESRLTKLKLEMKERKKSIPNLLLECSSNFAIDNWENREEYPDFLGESYNRICEDAVDSIICNDKKQFEIDFSNITRIVLLYHEYIRTDFVKNKDLYRIEYAYYMITAPIVEWAQIGGLAILWGEFYEDYDWKACVEKSSESMLKNGGETGIAEKLIEYMQDRNNFLVGSTSRNIIEISWKQSVENAIKNSGVCEEEYETFERTLKTGSKLLKAFCPDFIDRGFLKEPAEVFLVVCVNPFVAEDKRFRTKFLWEERMWDGKV